MILTDTFIVENAELLIEQRGGKTIRRLRGIFGRCDEKNNNGRVYSKPLLEREVKRIAEAMGERRLLGELDHPTHDAVKLSNVSHLITGLDFNGKELVGECELLDTPSGKVAQALVEGGVKIGISSRGMGTLSDHADGTKHVNEDFRLVTFDLVADPSTRGAFPGISESSLVEGIVKETYEKAAQEKVFTTMLKDKLREKMEGEGTQSAEWTKETVQQIQKKANKKIEKPTVQEPFKNWEYFYGWNAGKPKVRKTRSYADAETVTAPAEVTESKFCILKDVLLEDNGSASVLMQLLEALIKSKGAAFRTAKKTVRRPGAIKKGLAGAAEKIGTALRGGTGNEGGLAGKLRQTKRTVGSLYKKDRYNPEAHSSGAAKADVDQLKSKVRKERMAKLKSKKGSATPTSPDKPKTPIVAPGTPKKRPEGIINKYPELGEKNPVRKPTVTLKSRDKPTKKTVKTKIKRVQATVNKVPLVTPDEERDRTAGER